jgi:polyisoprenoid-binding protein YceI
MFQQQKNPYPMQRFLLPALALGTLALASAFTRPEAASVKADVAQSTITWKGRKVTGSHEGTVKLKSGALEFAGGDLTGGFFEIDMASIAVTDLQGDMAGKLEGHLKSDDFFGVEAYPSALFRITSVVSRGTPGDYKITGDATIKGKTQEVRFLASVDRDGGVATADITLDRTDYDVRYGSGSFFSNLGDKTIYDDFDLSVRLVLVQG